MTNAERIIALAKSQIGIKESPKNSNNVKYNTWYYGRDVYGSSYPWCMVFDQWVYDHAGCKLPYKTASCGSLLEWYRRNDPDCIVKIPVPACIVIFDFPNTKYTTDHTGILESIVGDYIITIDGNTGLTNEANGGAVMRRKRPIKYAKAFIKPRCLWESEDEMTDKEVYDALQRYCAGQTLPDWAEQEFADAVKAGITDGSAPCALIPRYQAAIMALRAKQGD